VTIHDVPSTPSRNELLREFYDAPDQALFSQESVSAVRGCSIALSERDRLTGRGPPYLKLGRLVKYRKADVLEWINRHQTFSSTSEYSQAQAA
jgi:hypothetical protein